MTFRSKLELIFLKNSTYFLKLKVNLNFYYKIKNFLIKWPIQHYKERMGHSYLLDIKNHLKDLIKKLYTVLNAKHKNVMDTIGNISKYVCVCKLNIQWQWSHK